MGVWAVTAVAAILGVVVAIWFELIELAVKEGTEELWDGLLGTDEHRWLVVPTATVLGVAYAALLRAQGEPRLVDEEPGIMPPDPDAPVDAGADVADGAADTADADAPGAAREDVGRIAVTGLGSLLAGASLGPEQMLVQSSGAMGTWTVRRLSLTAIAARALTLAAVGALMVAFLGSMVMVALPLLIAFQRLKRLPLEVVVPIVVAGLTAWSTLWLLDRQSMGFGSIPTPSDVAAVDYLAAAATGLAVGLLALLLGRLLRLMRRGAALVDRTWPWWLAGAGFGLGIGLLYLLGGPSVEFTGSTGTATLVSDHSGDGAWVLLGLALVKVTVTAWSQATGYRGGLYFPSIYAGVATGLAIGSAAPSLAGPGPMVGAVAGIFVGLGLPNDPDGDRQRYVAAVVSTLLFLIALLPLAVMPLALVAMVTAVGANLLVVVVLRRRPHPSAVATG